MLTQRCRFLTSESSLCLASVLSVWTQGAARPTPPASPTPGSRQLEVRPVTQVAGLSLGDLGPARLLGGPLVHRLLLSSPGALTRVSQPSSDSRRSPRTLTRFPAPLPVSPARLIPSPGGDVALSGLRAHTSPRALRTRPPRRRPPFLPPRRARSPRIPLSTLFRAPSLAHGPLRPGAGSPWHSRCGHCRLQGCLPDFGPSGDPELLDQRARESAALPDSPACPGSRAPTPTRDTAALQPAGASGVPGDLAKTGSMHSLPGSPTAPARAPCPRCAPLRARFGAA